MGAQQNISPTGNTIPDGYTPIGVLSYSPLNGNVVPIAVYGNSGNIYVKNLSSSSSYSITPTMAVCCAKI